MSIFSIIIVNHNGKELLKTCLQSLRDMDRQGFAVEILVIDNLSNDGSVEFLKSGYPEIIILENEINNYTRAVNLGISHAAGDYIILLNNDTVVEKNWIIGLYKMAEKRKNIGIIQSKIVFSDGQTINSVGVEEVEDFYFRDQGFGEKDKGQYEEAREINYFTGGSAMIKRECYQEVGEFDEDFIMFFEDIDYSIRCRRAGWKIFYSPNSIVFHKYHGTSSSTLCDYLCTRNRFLCLAKHFPFRLVESIKTSHFYSNNEYHLLYNSLIESVRKLVQYHGFEIVAKTIKELKQIIIEIYSLTIAYHFFSQVELMLGLRKMNIGIYDHAFHFPGGGQRYVAKMAEILQDEYNVTYITNKDVDIEMYKKWFNIDLSRCKLNVIKISFFEKLKEYFIDERKVIFEHNPFDIISEESIRYDIFINANMLSKVNPLSKLSLFICHFPDTRRGRLFYVDHYDYLVSNGEYTSSWIRKRWGLNPTHLLFPPVDMYNKQSSVASKQKVVLSVARFEIGGSKKQIEMMKAFADLATQYEHIRNEWKFIVAGGTFPNNPYFKSVEECARTLPHNNIELRPDVSYEELRTLYKEAAIFWHACGLNEQDPHLVEHFGMTTVEAMQNYCVPIVIDRGGQKEIVEHGVSGYRFEKLKELQSYTMKVVNDSGLRRELAERAYERSHQFNFEVFKKQVIQMFKEIENELMGTEYSLKDPERYINECE